MTLAELSQALIFYPTKLDEFKLFEKYMEKY